MIRAIPVLTEKYIAYDKLGHRVDAATLEYPDWINTLSQDDVKRIVELRVWAALQLTAEGHVVGTYDVMINERAELVSVSDGRNSLMSVVDSGYINDYILCHLQYDLDLEK